MGTSTVNTDIWTMATLPSGSEYGPIILVQGIVLAPGQTVDRERIQTVPGNAPAGNYTYDAYIGTYPDDILDEDHFGFEKLSGEE